MVERGLYYADNTFFELIRSVGGEWNDTKHRPMVCLLKSSECDDIYWAIPMGNCAHRSPDKLERIQRYLIVELERKLKRILSFENASPNSYRQHITDIKIYLMNECKESE